MNYDDPATELDAISKVLATDPQRYWKQGLDKRAVELRRQEEKPAAREVWGGQRIQSELDRINKVLRDDPQTYWKKNMGDRATELRRQLEQVKAANSARGR